MPDLPLSLLVPIFMLPCDAAPLMSNTRPLPGYMRTAWIAGHPFSRNRPSWLAMLPCRRLVGPSLHHRNIPFPYPSFQIHRHPPSENTKRSALTKGHFGAYFQPPMLLIPTPRSEAIDFTATGCSTRANAAFRVPPSDARAAHDWPHLFSQKASIHSA